ncbi:hypothetical protein [Aeromicrobium wangtongii]|uniref:Uncharacterized protein n=1 Tax=Aeromicrobium wangtongii TaxID=2969247 RepID=A0ABY5M8S0_9ACTN|nr:hypothetical protein [Aeromicrobium wangtongii]MCD9199891.1 hypothetical protein [Aeromicrobium wangtongii]UUP13509.1 hypothetical protein NQV15_16915 [Aeromicrobium wangtongii]
MGIVLALAGCRAGESDGPKKAEYTPVPDDTLFSQVAALPGVKRADVSFNDTWPEHTYLGEVDISPDADAQQVLDTVYAVLRQGRFDAGINVVGYQANREVRLEALPRSGGPAELEKRYGPQPGSGTPPGSP